MSNQGNKQQQVPEFADKQTPEEQQNAKQVPKMRWLVCFLSLFGVSLCIMSRLVINQVIMDMKKSPETNTHKTGSGIQLSLLNKTYEEQNQIKIYGNLITNRDNKLESKLVRLLNSSINNQIDELSQKDELKKNSGWSPKQKLILLGSFYLTYSPFMIIGGRISEMYGSKYVILFSVAGCAIANLLTPYITDLPFEIIVTSRLILGVLQAGILPAIYSLINKWTTVNESHVFAPLTKVALRLGKVYASILVGILSWQNSFYTAGTICFLWSVAWFFLSESEPKDSKFISKSESEHIEKKKKKVEVETKKFEEIALSNINSSDKNVNKNINVNEPKEKNTTDDKQNKLSSEKAPWLAIITHPSVIGLMLVKFGSNFALDFLDIMLPTYLEKIHGLTKEERSWYFTIPMNAIQVVFGSLTAWFVKLVSRSDRLKLSTTGSRKLFQTISSTGLCMYGLVIVSSKHNLIAIALSLYVASVMSCFATGGEVLLPLDLSRKYPATIMAVANSFANIGSLSVTIVAAFVLGNEEKDIRRWDNFYLIISAIAAFGGLAFLILAEAKLVDFNKKETKSNVHNNADKEAGIKRNTDPDRCSINLDSLKDASDNV